MRAIYSIAAAVILLSATTAHASDSRLGLRAGANWSNLSGPTDPAGEPTLQSGSGFDGMGIVGGAAAGIHLARFSDSLLLELELDVLVSTHSVSSLAESPASNQSREVELTAIMLRAPLLANLEYSLDSTEFRLGLGPALLLGLSSGSTVTQENIEGDVDPLFTTPVTHIGIEFGLGMSYVISDDFSIPFDLRFTYDPSVPSTTRERFDNFQSNDEPGQYQVGLDYQLLFTIGVDYRLNLGGS